jgi:hypothetical protein
MVIEIHTPWHGKLCHLSSWKAFRGFMIKWEMDRGEFIQASWVYCNGRPMRSWEAIRIEMKRHG